MMTNSKSPACTGRDKGLDQAMGTPDAMVVNIDGMAAVYLSQHDIARSLGIERTMINVWRSRYADFPEPDVVIGLGTEKPGIPGWHPDRANEIRAWLAKHPRLLSH